MDVLVWVSFPCPWCLAGVALKPLLPCAAPSGFSSLVRFLAGVPYCSVSANPL